MSPVTPRWRFVTISGPTVCAVALLASCGSGAVEGLDEERPGTSTSAETPSPEPEESHSAEPEESYSAEPEESYSWGLPGGDLSIDQIAGVYNRLRAGECSAAEEGLDSSIALFGDRVAGQISLYRAAIAACRGDPSQARIHLASASLTGHPGDCPLYKAVRSVVDQRPQDSITCPHPVDDQTTAPPSSSDVESPTPAPTASEPSSSPTTSPDSGPLRSPTPIAAP